MWCGGLYGPRPWALVVPHRGSASKMSGESKSLSKRAGHNEGPHSSLEGEEEGMDEAEERMSRRRCHWQKVHIPMTPMKMAPSAGHGRK